MNDIEQILIQVKKELEALPEFGQMQVHFKRHMGSLGNTDIVQITQKKFDPLDEPNVKATTMIFQLIKALADARASGSLSFNVTMKKGHVDTVQVQDFRKL